MFFKKKVFAPAAYDYLIVGLGNPGEKYELTRHNAGFLAIDTLAEKHGAKIGKIKFKSLVGDCQIGGSRCLLMKPQTFMNNSGEAVVEAMQFYKLTPDRVIIIFDDVSLDVGQLRLRRKGSDGGHNGVKSIIYLSGSDEYKRIKIGVGKKPHPDYDLADWVLGKFRHEDEKTLSEVFSSAADACECIITSGIDKAMNKFNR